MKTIAQTGPGGRAAVPTLDYRADIDGIRAIAVTLVLVFHFSLVSGVKAGFLGVDIFFVISGFLITSIVKRQLDANTFSLASFYISRIRRLAPALVTVLLLVACAGLWWLFPDDLVELSKQILVSQFYVANIYYWRNVNYFGLGVHDVFLLHTWSLAVEEQFYLIYPVCILLLHRRLKNYFWTAITLGFLVSFGLNILIVGEKPEATFYLLPTRAWELLAGALVPLIAAKFELAKLADELISLLGASLIVIAVTCYRSDFHFPGFYALLPVAGTACLLLTGQAGATVMARALSRPPIVYIGKISYSLYLVHWPINVFADRLIDDYSLGWRVAMLALSVALAALVYHVIEDPLRHRRYLATSPKMLVGYTSALAVCLTGFVFVKVLGGLPHRFPAETIRLASYVNDKADALTECESRFCPIGAEGQSPTWLIYGDSHAWAAHAAFDKWLRLNKQAGLFIFHHACPPVNGVHLLGDRGACFAFNRMVMDFIERHSDLRNIALVSIWRQAAEGRISTSSQTALTEDQSVHLFTDAFSQTLEHLHNLGRHVYVWEPVPGARKSVPLEMARATLDHKRADIEVTLPEYLSYYQFFFDAIERDQKWIDGTFSAYKTLCVTGKCAVEYQGNPLYADDNHITKSSVDVWVRVLQDGALAHAL